MCFYHLDSEMPILIKNYDWRQTQEFIIVRIPIKGVTSNADIFTSDNYIKIHSPPFLFEVCLWHPVIDTESVCTIDSGETTFKLVKQTAEEWPTLAAELTRQEALEVKKKAIDAAHERAKDRLEEHKAKKNERQRKAVREQICLNTQERELIDQRREQERKEALAQMGWSPSVVITELPDESNEKSIKKNDKKEIFKKSSNDSNNLIPDPRPSAQISVSFTPRVFPTPSRESQIAEEQEWLSKQAEARRKSGFLGEDLRPEEQDPVWLCNKAQSFYNMGNYLGAVSAYSHALTLNSQLYELHAGRAAAHLALGNYNRTLTDSSKALELLTPAVTQNEEARARCHLYRGSALAGLGLQPQALGELKAAHRLRPEDPEVQNAISQLENSQIT